MIIGFYKKSIICSYPHLSASIWYLKPPLSSPSPCSPHHWINVKNLWSTVSLSLDIRNNVRLTKVVRKLLVKSSQLLWALYFWLHNSKFPDISVHVRKGEQDVPGVILNQVWSRWHRIHRGLHRGTLLYNHACTSYCTLMLAMEKTISKWDCIPCCHKSIWWNQRPPFFDWHHMVSLR